MPSANLRAVVSDLYVRSLLRLALPAAGSTRARSAGRFRAGCSPPQSEDRGEAVSVHAANGEGEDGGRVEVRGEPPEWLR